MKSVTKYSKKTILDYISGNEVVGYDIEMLEKDIDFMLEVFKLTRDKRIYNLCDDSIKYDVNFIIRLLEIFKDDLGFCIELVNEFNKNCNDEISILEVNITLFNLFGASRNEKLIGIMTDLTLFYYKERAAYCYLVENEKSQFWKDNWAMGFWFVLNIYKTSPIIKDFFAKRMLNEIYKEDENFNLEKYLHVRFKSKEDLLKIGVKRYILNSIFGYDECLSGYLEQHSYLLSDVLERVNKVVDNWDDYRLYELDDILDLIAEVDDDYFLESDLVSYIAKEFNLSELKSLYSSQMDIASSMIDDDYCFQDMNDDEFDSYITEKSCYSDVYIGQPLESEEHEILFDECDFTQRKILLQLKKKVQDLISNGIEDDYVVSTDDNRMAKILNFHNNKDLSKV